MKIQLLKDTSTAVIDAPGNTLVIYRGGFDYKIPSIVGAEYIEFLDYKNKYTMLEPNMIILVGLNRIITPSNRCDFINEYMQTMTPNVPKISVDTAPFIGEPWRLWFHYSIANCGKFNITYSYIIETEWQHWFYRDIQDCRLSGQNIKLFLTDTVSDIQPLKTKFYFSDISEHENKWYQESKKNVFDKFNTPKMLINNILKLTNKYFGLKISYDSFLADEKIIVPDLPIYRFVSEECKRRMNIYNEVISYENIH